MSFSLYGRCAIFPAAIGSVGVGRGSASNLNNMVPLYKRAGGVLLLHETLAFADALFCCPMFSCYQCVEKRACYRASSWCPLSCLCDGRSSAASGRLATWAH